MIMIIQIEFDGIDKKVDDMIIISKSLKLRIMILEIITMKKVIMIIIRVIKNKPH